MSRVRTGRWLSLMRLMGDGEAAGGDAAPEAGKPRPPAPAATRCSHRASSTTESGPGKNVIKRREGGRKRESNRKR